MISVAQYLDKERAMFNRPVLGPFESLSHFIDIVSLESDSRNSISSGIEVRIHGRSLD